jgi:hypothetical protein
MLKSKKVKDYLVIQAKKINAIFGKAYSVICLLVCIFFQLFLQDIVAHNGRGIWRFSCLLRALYFFVTSPGISDLVASPWNLRPPIWFVLIGCRNESMTGTFTLFVQVP